MIAAISQRPLVGLLLLSLAACGSGKGDAKNNGQGMGPEPAPLTNRIDVPNAVRKNLGITFSKVEMRRVASTKRVPGRFELEPEAHRAYHTTLSGQVDLRVRQYQQVQPDDILFRVNSAEWRTMQAELAETVNAIRRDHARVAVLKKRAVAVQGHADRLRAQYGIWAERVKQIEALGAAGGGIASARTEARAALAAVETAQAEVHEEEVAVEGQQTELATRLAGYHDATPLLYADALGIAPPPSGAATKDLALSRAAALLGLTVEQLRERTPAGDGSIPRWRVIESIDVVAKHAGVVEELDVTNGAWIHAGDKVLDTVDPTRIRFRGAGLQADLGRLHSGMEAVVTPPSGNGGASNQGLRGTVVIGLEADPLTRKIDLILTPTSKERPAWARAGVSTEMEVVLEGTDEEQLAIPLRAVIQDGLEKIVFRRDPKNKDQVIRLAADLGLTDGKWIVIESGVMEGDQVVHDGVYELMLASGGAGKEKGGHFHADGTFHEGDDH